MIEISKNLREKLIQKPNSSTDDYFKILADDQWSRIKIIYGRTITNKTKNKSSVTKDDSKNGNSKYSRNH